MNLKEDFATLLEKMPQTKEVIEKLSKKGELVLIGGSVRHYLQKGFKTLPRDFDLVVDVEEQNLEDCFTGIPFSKNSYGGYKLFLDGTEFDIWAIPITWAFREGKVTREKVSDLVKTPFLDYDSVAYNLSTGEMYDGGYKEATERKEISINLKETLYPALNIARAIVFCKEQGMKFSKELLTYTKEWYWKNKELSEKEFNEAQMKHYKTIKATLDDLKEKMREK